jgi:hypothetical protein
LVYGHDESRHTAEVMLEGALHFAPLLRDLLGAPFDAVEVARPFTYVVADDSMVGIDDLWAHHQFVDARMRALLDADSALDYLGMREPPKLERLGSDQVQSLVPGGRAVAAFRTPECSVSTWQLADCVRAAMRAEQQIVTVLDTTVLAVERRAHGFGVHVTRGDAEAVLDADQVVNCLWDGRLAIDETIAVAPPRPWAYRLKYRALFDASSIAASQPSLTIALGPYGDVVLHDREQVGYASWYPVCLQGWSSDVGPPTTWLSAAGNDGVDEVADRVDVAKRTMAALDEWCPGLAAAPVLDVAAGVIMAWGETDIVDHGSRLHRRDELGVWSHDGYHTVETGKFTCAPLIGRRAAAAVIDP